MKTVFVFGFMFASLCFIAWLGFQLFTSGSERIGGFLLIGTLATLAWGVQLDAKDE